MSLYIDRKYLLLISPQLERFSVKNENLFNFRCPFCGDSQKNKLKCRGYVYQKGNDYFYICHNCGTSHNFSNFINFVDSGLYSQYRLEKFANANTMVEIPREVEKEYKANPIELPSIMALNDEHYAKIYVKSRMIPEQFWKDLYFASDFKAFVAKSGAEEHKGLIENDPRLIIPFYNKKNEMVYFQGRALSESKIRYITISINKNYPKLFGMERVNTNYKTYVVEGPIDSMFLPNSIATADSDLSKALVLGLNKYVLIYDNQPRNKEIVMKIEKSILQGHSVCLLPESNQKDINEMVLNGMSIDNIKKLIDDHSYSGLRARIEFNNWRKV